MRLNAELARRAARAAGGRIVLGPRGRRLRGRGRRASARVHVRDAARTRPLAADAVVLATGGFAAGGLELDSRGGLRETVLGLPVSGPPPASRRSAPATSTTSP